LSKRDYEKWLADGPEQLSLPETTAALEWRDANREQAFHIKRAYEAHVREEQAKDTLKSQWLADGGDVSQFQAAYEKMSAAKRTEKLKAMEEEARSASQRDMWRSF
jgi:hypothetical protein